MKKKKPRSPLIRRLETEARRLGYTITYRDFVEDSKTPGILGQIAGRCDYETKEIVISTFNRSRQAIEAILKHELEHANGAEVASDYPEFGIRCGNRH